MTTLKSDKSILLFILSLVNFFILLFIDVNSYLHCLKYLTLIVIAIINVLVLADIRIKNILALSFLLFPTILGFFLSTIFFNNGNNILLNSTILSVRLFSISFISIIYMLHLNMIHTIYFFMIKLKLSPKYGYPIIVAINSIGFLKKEYLRIRAINKMRFYTNRISFSLIYTILVNSIRYSNAAASMMEARGINSNKTFIYNKMFFNYYDCVILILNIVIIVVLFNCNIYS